MNMRKHAAALARPSVSYRPVLPSNPLPNPLTRTRRATLVAVAAASLFVAGCGGDGGGRIPYVDLSGVTPPAVPVVSVNTLQGSTKDVSVEFHEGTNMAAAPSPDGKRIAFTAMGALWTLPASGGTATRITSWDMEPTAPVWSPNGSLIAFQNYDAEGNYHIWVVRPNGADLRRVTTGPYDDREPAWTPDGNGLVFASDRSNDGQYKVWRVSLSEPAYAALTTGPGAESNPVVSPDGKQLAFVDTARVFTKTIGGSEAPKLVGAGTMPAWTPDGSGLVFQNDRKALTVAGKDVAPGEDFFPFPVRYMSDGRFMYTADGKIRIRSAAGTEPADVPFSAMLTVRRPAITKVKDRGFNVMGPQPVRGISGPVISPDGQSVAFVALNDVWVMKIGQAPVRLTNDIARDGSPQFTPDGLSVYFSTEKDNAGALAIDQVEIATKKRTRLAAIRAKSMVTPKMSPTGDRIAYTTGSGQLEVWDVGSRTAQTVIAQVSSQVSTPSWLPDGKKVVLVDNERMNNRFREGYNKLRVIDVAAKTGTFYPVAEVPRQISDREEGAATVSPDGTKVAFIMDSVLHVMPLKPDGSPAGAPVAITKEAADLPSWAGDSRTILYKATDKLKTIAADGSSATEVPLTLSWTQAVSKGTTIVHAGRLWDGNSENLRTDVDIVIDGNRITAIRPHDPSSAKTAAKFIDASALTVMPGLWDPHFHPLTLYQGGQFGQVAASMLAYGITSTQSVAGPLHQSIEMHEALDSGNLVGPRVFVSPPLWEGNRLFYSFARTLRTPEVADLEIAKAKAMGVDYLKSYVRAPIPIMTKIAQAGLDMGVPTGTHMLAPGAAAGIAGTTHLSATQRMGYGWSKSVGGFTYQDAYDLHAKADFHLVDTLFSSLALVGQDASMTTDDRFNLLIPPNFLTGLTGTAVPTDAVLQGARKDAEQSAKVQRAGGLMAIGTDTPLVAPGIALQTNLRAAGMAASNFQALQDVTINAAKMSRVDKDLGTVEVGKLADLVVVRGNPLQDLKAAAAVEYVVKNGVSMSLAEILAPFRTPLALSERRKAVVAYEKMCRADPHECADMNHAD
ncbi:amidohydrolase family protein [Variovorax sp. VaC1]|uniref:amidohydrolase family protein n=1 Tax=Variovorax sp. VaC1 TaxID=3373132 RepID=UPI0037492F75